jgi:hypothetical protein
MSALAKSLLLFTLNWLDGQLTLVWVHSNIASEGNGLMNHLLNLGDGPFIFVNRRAHAAFTLSLSHLNSRPVAACTWC